MLLCRYDTYVGSVIVLLSPGTQHAGRPDMQGTPWRREVASGKGKLTLLCRRCGGDQPDKKGAYGAEEDALHAEGGASGAEEDASRAEEDASGKRRASLVRRKASLRRAPLTLNGCHIPRRREGWPVLGGY